MRFRVGDRVRHPKHGPGTIVGLATVQGAYLVEYIGMGNWCKATSEKTLSADTSVNGTLSPPQTEETGATLF